MTIHPLFQWQCNADKALFLFVLRQEWLERFHSHGRHLCKFIGTKGSVYIRKEFDPHGTGLEHQHGRRFLVLEHQYGRRDVTWKHSTLLISDKWYNGCTYESGSASLTVLLWRCLDAEPSLLASPSRCLWRWWWWWCDLKQNKNKVTKSTCQCRFPDPP